MASATLKASLRPTMPVATVWTIGWRCQIRMSTSESNTASRLQRSKRPVLVALMAKQQGIHIGLCVYIHCAAHSSVPTPLFVPLAWWIQLPVTSFDGQYPTVRVISFQCRGNSSILYSNFVFTNITTYNHWLQLSPIGSQWPHWFIFQPRI